MITPHNFWLAWEGAAVITVVAALGAAAGFVFGWGIRFRLVGVTGFMGVLAGGLLALSLAPPLMRSLVPGAVHYSLVFDNGANQAVIVVPPGTDPPAVEATLRQAAGDLLLARGRLQRSGQTITLRARTLLHPQPGVSQPLYLGEAYPQADGSLKVNSLSPVGPG